MHISEPLRMRRRISLTPLIDVIFLLLMFFMLSSTFSRFGEFELGSQSQAAGAATEPPAAASTGMQAVMVAVSNTRGVRVNGEPVALEALASQLETHYDQGARTAVVVADSGATVQDLVSVLERARGSSIAVVIAR